MLRQAVVTMNTAYYGRFHAFVRGGHISGVAGTVNVRLTYSPGDGSSEAPGAKATVTRTFPVLNYNNQILDFGEIVLGPAMDIYPFDMRETFINLEAQCTDAGGATVYFADIVLMPVDEWAWDCEDMFKNNGDPSLINDYLTYLNVDAIQNPRIVLSHLVEISTGDIARYWRPITNGIPILENATEQRLWFLSFREEPYTGTTYSPANIEIAHTIQIWRNQRYTTLRGDQ